MKTNPENSLESLKEVLPVLEGVEDWTEENIHDALFDLIGKLGVKNGIVLWPLRVAVSGKAFTPGGGVEISYLISKQVGCRISAKQKLHRSPTNYIDTSLLNR